MMDLVQDSLNAIPSIKQYRTAEIIDGNLKYQYISLPWLFILTQFYFFRYTEVFK
jgi:hypothetical protein